MVSTDPHQPCRIPLPLGHCPFVLLVSMLSAHAHLQADNAAAVNPMRELKIDKLVISEWPCLVLSAWELPELSSWSVG